MQGCGGAGPSRAGQASAAHGVRPQPRLYGMAGGEYYGMASTSAAGGRASRDYYGMARPPATGGGQVGGRAYYGMAGARAAGGSIMG